MNQFLLLVLLVFSSLQASADLTCSEALFNNVVPIGNGEVRIYAAPGVIIPRQIKCDYCGEASFMPASLDEVTIINTDADIDALQAETGGKAPDTKGATVRCDSCAGHTALWKVNHGGELLPAATTTRLPIHTDHALGRRYVVLPERYVELADPNSEMNRLVHSQLMGICPSCSTTSMLPEGATSGANCSGCGTPLPDTHIFDLKTLLNKVDKAAKARLKAARSGSGKSAQSKRNIQDAPEKTDAEKARAEEKKKAQRDRQGDWGGGPGFHDAQTVRPDGNLDGQQLAQQNIQNGRQAMRRFSGGWLAAGVVAAAVVGGAATYFMTNTPVIAQGKVISVQSGVAHIVFQETPYFVSDSAKTYDADVVLSERNTLPGEEDVVIEQGDSVTVHYNWAEFHLLSFVIGAEFQDGSVVGEEGIK